MNINDIDFKTGDIILYASNKGFFDKMIQKCSRSKYVHVAMVIKDPPTLKKGAYIIESCLNSNHDDFIDHKKVNGVQIHPLRDAINTYDSFDYYYRKVNITKKIDNITEKVWKIEGLLHGKPYDTKPLDWLEAEIRTIDPSIFHKQRTNTFWCSALVSYIYVKLGLMNIDVPWTLVSPKEFGTERETQLPFQGCNLDSEIKIIF